MAKSERTPENIALGKRIKRVREEFAEGIDQGKFAAPLGVSRQAVVQWENGKGAGRNSLLKVAREYQVSFEWLASDIGEPRGVSSPPVVEAKPRPISNEHAKLTGRLGELFAEILKANENVQREAIEALEELVPAKHHRTRVTKTNEQS